MSSSSEQRDSPGFGIEAGIVIVALLAALVYWITPGADTAKQKELAANQETGGALLIQQSSTVYDAMVRYLNDGGHKNVMTLDANPTSGIFAEHLESGRPPNAHPGFFEHAENAGAKWMLNDRFIPEQKDQEWYGLVLAGLKKSLCQRLNAILHKDAVNAEPAHSVYTREQWISGRVELNGADSRLTRRDGCAAASDGDYVFYRAMIRR